LNDILQVKTTSINNSEWIGIVAENVESLKFGVVQITVHESRVVQIEKTEKIRLERADTSERTTLPTTPVAANSQIKTAR
jgi:hypothetical protein